ncbi:thyrotropin-releasing hormone-degrading ectoenzyme-like [Musca vetustissima]|uniref:thyrotropin-releasing hormone-degrading ectoenzyme-like n=1 Tax=Musca vetustissima TaxID=27455 RepID=UPI002AB66B0F|nr:thyrotropin-releasing hormone-degrading ectoenzyme-like [Musca vetustissima]
MRSNKFIVHQVFWGLIFLFILPTSESSYSHYRLPSAVKPDHYHLKLITYLEESNNFTFSGKVSIEFEVLEETSNITLHVRNLTVDKEQIALHNIPGDVDVNNFNFCLQNIETIPEHDYYIIQLCEPLSSGQRYNLTLSFEGILNDDLTGYYRSSYVNEMNETQLLSVTQFEPTYARKAFPCFDEPNYKATFTIWLGHNKSLKALSNMPLQQQIPLDDVDDFVWSIFEESVSMSTYLVAYSINDFVCKETKRDDSEVVFRTWCRPEYYERCRYAAEIAPDILKYYEELFGIAFPFTKVDQIAVPQFSQNAMENWGLITYYEDIFLTKENLSDTTTFEEKQNIATVIAHELAHQWFGNLVTMEWWTDIWLSEGFSTYISTLGVASLYPELPWQAFDTYDNFKEFFVADAKTDSHAISNDKCNSSDIMKSFDAIAYRKGAAVLRMTHMSMGPDWFFDGICGYLNKHRYSTATQDDLWQAFTDAFLKTTNDLKPPTSIKTIMDSWTLQAGYPLVEIERNYEAGTMEISQQRFLSQASNKTSPEGECWWTPLSYTTAAELDFNSTIAKVWLECDSNSGNSLNLTLENIAAPNDWILFNIQMVGVYRVSYDPTNLRLLAATLNSENFKDIHVMNRMQIVEDIKVLAWEGHQSYDIYFEIFEYLHREDENWPWESAIAGLRDLSNIFAPFPLMTKYLHTFMRYIIEPYYHRLGGLNGTRETSDIHSQIIMVACFLELPDCVHAAQEYFEQWKTSLNTPSNLKQIPSELKTIVYCNAVRFGPPDNWDFLWQHYLESRDHEILLGLGCSRNETVLRNFVQLYQANSNESNIDVFFYIYRSVTGVEIIRDYFKETINNWTSIDVDVETLLLLSFHLVRPNDLNAFEELININPDYFKDYEEIVEYTRSTIAFRLQWIERNLEDIKFYLYNRLTQMGLLENNTIEDNS